MCHISSYELFPKWKGISAVKPRDCAMVASAVKPRDCAMVAMSVGETISQIYCKLGAIIMH